MSQYGDIARLYDAEYGRVTDDIAFYLERLCERRVRGPILELGCGTGRVATPLAQAGHRVTGLDISEKMLRRARRRRQVLEPETSIRLRFSAQDMTTFRFPRRFAAAIVAFSTFNLLPTPAARRACLERTAAQLEPGGLLLLDLAAPTPARASDAGPCIVTSFRVAPWGHLVHKWVGEVADPATGVVEVCYDYRVERFSDGVEVDRLTVRFALARLQLAELEAVLDESCFDVEETFGSYRGHPYGPRSPRLIVEARRRA